MRLGPNTRLCDDDDAATVRDIVHTWDMLRPLDVVAGVLSVVRECVRCGAVEHKPYGGRSAAWRRTPRERTP